MRRVENNQDIVSKNDPFSLRLCGTRKRLDFRTYDSPSDRIQRGAFGITQQRMLGYGVAFGRLRIRGENQDYLRCSAPFLVILVRPQPWVRADDDADEGCFPIKEGEEDCENKFQVSDQLAVS